MRCAFPAAIEHYADRNLRALPSLSQSAWIFRIYIASFWLIAIAMALRRHVGHALSRASEGDFDIDPCVRWLVMNDSR